MKTLTKYIIYDARYTFDPDRANIFEVCDTKEEAEEAKFDYGTDCVVVREEFEDKDNT